MCKLSSILPCEGLWLLSSPWNPNAVLHFGSVVLHESWSPCEGGCVRGEHVFLDKIDMKILLKNVMEKNF
jgi:hypothetical protein